MKKWNEVDKDGNINIPDYLDGLVNFVGNQIRFHTLSGKNEIQTICDIVYKAEKFAKNLLIEYNKWIDDCDNINEKLVNDFLKTKK